jgi:sensor histidine kinase YesM
LGEENQSILRKKTVDKRRDSVTFPPIMNSDSLNGVLTFVLGVLVVLAVILAMRMALLTHETRVLQRQAQIAQEVIVQTQAVYNDAAAYNQRANDPTLARILQGAKGNSPAH